MGAAVEVTEIENGSMPDRQRRMEDLFSDRGRKLAALFGISGSRPALLIGDALSSWQEDLSRAFSRCDFAYRAEEARWDAVSPGGYGLVLWAPERAERVTGAGLDRLLPRIRSALAPEGSLLLWSENRLSLRRLRERPWSVVAAGAGTAGDVRARLSRAGFGRIEEFLPLPSLRGAEEFVSSARGEIALASHESHLSHALNRLGLLRYLHDGFLFLASAAGEGTHRIVERIERHVEIGQEGELGIEHFFLRDRGALVLLLRDDQSARRLACRIATSREVEEVIARNTEWTSRIHADPRISDWVRARVPAPHPALVIGERAGFIEEVIPGTLAWKQAGSDAAREALLAEAHLFLREFNRQTAERRQVDGALFERIIEGDTDESVLSAIPASAAGDYASIRALLAARMLGSDRYVVWGHGDFGYGNVLVDPRTMRLTGVIDWDRAAETELAGIDLLNFLVQSFRTEHCPLTEAMRRTGEIALGGGFAAFGRGIDYGETFSLGREEIPELMGVLALRMLHRAARYPSLLARSEPQFRQILQWARQLLESGRAVIAQGSA